MTKQKYLTTFLKISLFGLAAYFMLINHLNTEVFRIYDETRIAFNSLEMFERGDFIALYYNGELDMWNTKPPLLHWIQVFFIHLLGFNEVALRLPSAIAAIGTCGLLMWFSLKWMKSYWFGMLSILILLSAQGFVDNHTARHCEYDSLLTFFTTLYSLSFFLYLENDDTPTKLKFLNWTFVGLTLAVLTKGIAGLLMTPGIILFMILRKQFIPTLKRWQSYRNLALFLVFTLGYYFLREWHTSGYLEAIWENEIGGRYLKETRESFYWYYYRYFLKTDFSFWAIFLLSGIGLGFLWKNPNINRLTSYILLVTSVFFIVITCSKTQYTWYSMPMFPMISMVAVLPLFYIFKVLQRGNLLQLGNINPKIISIVVVLSICYHPYFETMNKVANRPDLKDTPNYDISYFVREAVHGKRDLNGYHLCQSKKYLPHPVLYIKLLEKRGEQYFLTAPKDLKAGNKVMAHEADIKNQIQSNYNYNLLETYKSVDVYEIIEKKNAR